MATSQTRRFGRRDHVYVIAQFRRFSKTCRVRGKPSVKALKTAVADGAFARSSEAGNSCSQWRQPLSFMLIQNYQEGSLREWDCRIPLAGRRALRGR